MLDQIAQALSRGSSEAVVLVAAAGADARPAVLGALASASPLTRHIAVACLRGIADPRDVPVYFSLLADPALTVRLQASQAILENHAQIPVLGGMLTDALKIAKDSGVRIALSRALGDRPDTDVAALAELETQQTDPDVRAQVIAALAKQGSPPHIEAFLRALSAARGDERGRWLALADYVGASFLLPVLATLLDDEEPLVYLGVCQGPEPAEGEPRYLRTCDIAARLIAQLTHEDPDFTPQPGWAGLTKEQRGQMREIAARNSPTPPSPGAAR